MHLILVGHNSEIGWACLWHMVSHPGITRITILSEAPVPLAWVYPEKIRVLVHSDFSRYPGELIDFDLEGAEGCVWALGASSSHVGRGEYEQITLRNPLAAARAFSVIGESFRFIYVSGTGATTSPKWFHSHSNIVEGEAESSLLFLTNNIPSLEGYSVRPGFLDSPDFLDPHHFNHTLPPVPWVTKARKSVALKIMSLQKKKICPIKDLARVLVDLAMRDDGLPLEGEGIEGEGRTITNVGIRRLAGI